MGFGLVLCLMSGKELLFEKGPQSSKKTVLERAASLSSFWKNTDLIEFARDSKEILKLHEAPLIFP